MTILFINDWYDSNKNPRAIVHTTTKNLSFRRMAIVLRKMGIKNNLFHLCLYDPKLLNIDPHALDTETDPEGELRLRVAAECKRNVWYFLREVLRIPSDGSDSIPFNLHRGNLSMTWCFMVHLDYSGTQPRQSGKTVGAISLTAWVMYISGWKMTIGMLTHSADLVQANVKRLKGMREGLPPYLIHANGDGLDTDNKEGLDYKALGNSYYTYIGQPDKSAANRVGRGKTGPMLHIDEIGFTRNIKITFPAIMATTNQARLNAKAAGQPHSNLYTTTAADPTHEDGAFAFDLIVKAMPFTEKLYDSENEQAAHAIVKTNSINGLVNGTFSYLQLGYTHAWFKDVIARNNVPPDEVRRDYLNEWITAAKYPIVSKDVLERIHKSRAEPHHVEVFGNYVISWYVPRQISGSAAFRNSSIVMGMDSSEAIGRDFTTFVAICPKTLRILFTFRCNDSNTTKIALFVAQLMLEFSKLVFVPERKSTGATIIDTVIMMLVRDRQNPYLRIFNQIVDRRDHKEMQNFDLHDIRLADSTARKYLGFMTTASSRSFLYKQVLQRASELAADVICDSTLITEISGLQAINGRIDHGTGHHDDMCFVGATLVRTITGNRPISDLAVGDLVLTRKGYKPILHVYCHEKTVISKYDLTGTANHPFITPTGIVEFGNLIDASEVYVWNEKQSSIMTKRIIDTLSQDASHTKITTTGVQPQKLQKEVVYNLCVAECHEYFVNDILVHNCIAWLMACYLVLEGKNLHYYGLTSENLMPSVITNAQGGLDPKYAGYQLQLRKQIQALELQMKASDNEAVKAHFRYKIAQLQHHVDATLYIEPISVETVRRETIQLKPLSDNKQVRPLISHQEFLEALHF